MKSEALLMRYTNVGGPSLIPENATAEKALRELELGAPVAIKIVRNRSLRQHRLYWGVLQHVGEASHFETADALHDYIKIKLKMFKLREMPDGPPYYGKVVPVLYSTSFDAMDQDEFRDYFDKALALICSEVIPGTDSADLIAEVQSMLGEAA
jgi:hypothetical protein